MRVIEHPLVPAEIPVLRVRPNCPMTDEGRAKMNAWLLEVFGMKQVVWLAQEDSMFINPKHIASLRAIAP